MGRKSLVEYEIHARRCKGPSTYDERQIFRFFTPLGPFALSTFSHIKKYKIHSTSPTGYNICFCWEHPPPGPPMRTSYVDGSLGCVLLSWRESCARVSISRRVKSSALSKGVLLAFIARQRPKRRRRRRHASVSLISYLSHESPQEHAHLQLFRK